MSLDRPEAPPLRPHDPEDRVVVAELDGWEARVFPSDGRMHEYFLPRGLLHVQLWHPVRRVSVLSPSRLTLDRWEVFPVAGWSMPIADERILRDIMATKLASPLPRRSFVEAMQRWFVDAPLRRAITSRPEVARQVLERALASD